MTFSSVVKGEYLVVMQYLASLAIHEAILEKTVKHDAFEKLIPF